MEAGPWFDRPSSCWTMPERCSNAPMRASVGLPPDAGFVIPCGACGISPNMRGHWTSIRPPPSGFEHGSFGLTDPDQLIPRDGNALCSFKTGKKRELLQLSRRMSLVPNQQSAIFTRSSLCSLPSSGDDQVTRTEGVPMSDPDTPRLAPTTAANWDEETTALMAASGGLNIFATRPPSEAAQALAGLRRARARQVDPPTA